MEKSPDDDDEVISRLQKSIEVSVERTTKEVIVQNIQMIVEKIEKIEVHQLQFSYQMAEVQLRRNDDCRYLSKRFPHRSSTSTRALLSRVETVKSQIVQKSSKVQHKIERYPIVLQKTTRSGLLLSLYSWRPTAKAHQADA